MSIWRARDMRQIFDSGSDFEDAISRFKPSVFNADTGEAGAIPASTSDSKSDEKYIKMVIVVCLKQKQQLFMLIFYNIMGPEPENIEIGEYKGRKLIFVSHEEPGGIFLYSVGKNPRQPVLEDVWIEIPDTKLSWEELYNRNAVSELDTEDLSRLLELVSH
ncbi:hypothetical protein KUTeg_002554 [Tegillarca granosa]|uniref:Uncharacterized protein n=1 Tax=Tegillarca granosa TaxID=220873 RepID=A0ABQ9FY80_TEGGR|nr:hypothetical protein KUTeg_002554 [Tegillarca granosa]